MLIAFDKEVKPEELPKNICLVQLCNKVTYERIKESLDRLEQMEINEASMSLIMTLFGIRDPTFRNEFKDEKEKNTINFFNPNLNMTQQQAVRFCLEANELALIHGPPGTGKTTTVVEFILQSLLSGIKILVVAPSNIAVDNIAEKLLPFRKSLNFDLCRIGHPARLLENIIEVSLDNKIEKSSNTKFVKDIKREIEKKRKELNKTEKYKKEERRNLKNELWSLKEDIKGSYKNTVIDIFSKNKVILSTCVGAGDYYLKESLSKYNQGVFDLIVIDECAQGTESLCWIPIQLGKKLVLAGDHLQLPPTIKSKEAEKALSFTLFDRMIKKYGDRCAKLLDIQYRMNETIMKFSSDELYGSKLKADESVKNHKISDLPAIKKENDEKLEILDKNLIYVNTNGFEFYESVDIDSSSKYNLGESKLCENFVKYLLETGVKESEIGIITPYSAQVNFLRSLLSLEEYKEVEISTVDGFQGREKEVIILSLVRSNKKKEIGFLADNRRLNVAITRARRMLFLISDFSTVGSHPFIKKLTLYFEERGHELNLMESLIDFKQIEDIKYESLLSQDKKEEKTKQQSKSNPLEKKKKIKKKNLNDKEDDIHEEKVKSTEDLKNDHKINSNYKKEEVDYSFIVKIQKLIQEFILSEEDEYKIEGLSNSERRYIHCYAEIKNLIHESVGDSEHRILVLRKKKMKKINSPERMNKLVTKGKKNINNINFNFKEDSQRLTTPSNIALPISDSNCQILSSQNNINISNPNLPCEKKTNTDISNTTNVSNLSNLPTPSSKKNKNNTKAKTKETWDEIDDLLDQIQETDKNKCNFNNCSSSNNTKCQNCNFHFCDSHIRGYIHSCSIYNSKDVNYSKDFLKNKVSNKISELEEKRNKKPIQKKKK